jgi:ribonuclease HI
MKTTETSTWSAPPEGWVKLNTDVSFIGADKPSGAGAVARCSDGRVVLAACSPIATCYDAEDAEAKAALLGAKLMQGMCYDNIILETDCVAVASALRSNDINRSKQWSIYDGTKLLLKNYTTEMSRLSMPRERAIGWLMLLQILPDRPGAAYGSINSLTLLPSLYQRTTM